MAVLLGSPFERICRRGNGLGRLRRCKISVSRSGIHASQCSGVAGNLAADHILFDTERFVLSPLVWNRICRFDKIAADRATASLPGNLHGAGISCDWFRQTTYFLPFFALGAIVYIL